MSRRFEEIEQERAVIAAKPEGLLREIEQGDTVAVWGCGPVGQFAIASAVLLGAERVIAIDPGHGPSAGHRPRGDRAPGPLPSACRPAMT